MTHPPQTDAQFVAEMAQRGLTWSDAAQAFGRWFTDAERDRLVLLAAQPTCGTPTTDWRPVEGYEGRYEVSSAGEVRTVSRTLEQWANDQGYALVRVSEPRAVLRVHRVVAQAFIPNPDGLPCVNHLDCSPANNSVTNLEWCTQAQNIAHSRALGRYPDDYWKGKRSPNAKLTDETVQSIRAAYATGNYSWQQLAKEYGISKHSIGRIVRGESYV